MTDDRSSSWNISFDFLNKPYNEDNFEKLTVKFYTPDAKVFTQAFPRFYSIEYIKKKLADLFTFPSESIELLYKEDPIPDETRLDKFQPDNYGVLEFKLICKDRRFTIPIENAYKDLVVPDIITVQVKKDNEINEVVVEIDNRAINKPFLGGYKDVNTGLQYHHGYTQTGPPKSKLTSEMKNHRDTQTYDTRNRTTELEYARATQVPTKSIYIPSVTDKILTAGPYETAEERDKRLDIVGKVKTVQRYFRSWRTKCKLKELSSEYRKRVRLEQERDELEKYENEQRKTKDLVRKVFPMKPEDFAMLFNMVDRWKKSEIQRIASMSCGPSKIADFYLLLEKEVEILQSIELLRNKMKKDMEIKKIIDFFKYIGSPIEWDSEYKQLRISRDSLETQKGREYYRLYMRLCDKNLSREEKLGVYLDVKQYLQSHSCSESQEIISLIDRICELIARRMSGISELHKRITSMVLHHFKLQECNEGVTQHIIKVRKQHMNKNLIYCQSCLKLKPIESFTIHARTEKIKLCNTCKWVNKADDPWIDLSPYKFVLRQIRNYERLHEGKSSISFILKDRDIHYIVINIWHGHSALSECSDIYQLRLVRWDIEREWSPWNCILLTLEEAKVHLRVQNLEDVYEKEFINHIFNKHALARKHFKHLTTYDKHFAEFAKGNKQLDDNSEYYNKPIFDCDIDKENDETNIRLSQVNEKEDLQQTHSPRDEIEIQIVDEFIENRIYNDSEDDDQYI